MDLTENSFYDAIVDEYDRMTSFERRLEAAREFADKLLASMKIDKAVDMACGTGLYAIALAQKGVKVSGIDISGKMIETAQRNAAAHDLAGAISWRVAGMQDPLTNAVQGQDVVICMANSLPHVLKNEEFSSTIQNFKAMLRPGGMVVIQLLNYHRILRQRERIVSIDRADAKEYIRFYDFLDDGTLRFNIIRVAWPPENMEKMDSNPDHDLHSIRLRPYTYTEISAALSRTGFDKITFYGSPRFTDFNPDESVTVMITAEKLV